MYLKNEHFGKLQGTTLNQIEIALENLYIHDYLDLENIPTGSYYQAYVRPGWKINEILSERHKMQMIETKGVFFGINHFRLIRIDHRPTARI